MEDVQSLLSRYETVLDEDQCDVRDTARGLCALGRKDRKTCFQLLQRGMYRILRYCDCKAESK